MQRLKRQITQMVHGYYFWVSFAVVLIVSDILIYSIHEPPSFAFNDKVDLAAAVAIPLLALTLLRLWYARSVEKATFLKEYISKFFTDDDLYEVFHSLIYTYTNSQFDAVDAAIQAWENDPQISETGKTHRPVFAPFDHLQGSGEDKRAKGNRLYHPRYFQTSPEELRLDRLFGYFNVLGYYYEQKLLSMEEIAGGLGYYLNIIARRKVITTLRNLVRAYAEENSDDLNEQIQRINFRLSNGNLKPFAYVDCLLEGILKYDAEETRKKLPRPVIPSNIKSN